MKRLFMFFLLLSWCGSVFAQERVSGKVLDSSGSPVIGAAVLVNGNAISGTMTDMNGEFTLSVKAGETLQIQALGYKTKVSSPIVFPVGTLVFSLEDDMNLLDDVVVIGYGSARKGDVTGSISSVRGDLLAERNSAQLSTALQGQIAGLQITRSSGDPSVAGTVRIHGVTTMSTNDPLVIIDGVPGEIDDVMPEDILTLAVLKDAASASIYGSRAAAGVILITTKRAQERTFRFEYNNLFSVATPAAKASNSGVVDYMTVANEVKWNDGASQRYSAYSEDIINSWMENHAADPIHYPDTDWPSLILRNTATSQRHGFTMTGGTDKLSSKFSFNYLDSDGYYKNKSYTRYSFRLNNDYHINSWLKANIDAHMTSSDSGDTSANSNPVLWAYRDAPYYAPYWADGSYADVKDGDNYLAALNEGGTSSDKLYRVGGKVQLDITPVKNLTLTAVAAPELSFNKYKSFQKKVLVYREDGTPVIDLRSPTTKLTEKRNDTRSMTWQAYANYNFKTENHSLSLMAGYEGFSYEWENLGAIRDNYILTNFPYLDLGPEDYQYNSGTAGHNSYQSVFGRVMYSYKNRYLLQANIRSDGSSRFAKGHRWGLFPSVSAGWVLSDEPWFKSGVVSYLKLRASYGQLGNERIGSEFPYQATMDFGNSYLYDSSKNTVTAVQNAHQTYYAFEDITWETTTSKGLGIDATFFDGRLRFTGDIYHKKTEDMLLTLGFPSYSGFSAPEQNAGDMYTRGFDVEIGWSDRIGDFSYSISANLSDYRSKMGYLGDKTTISGNYIIEKGSYYREWYMLESDGLIMTDADMLDADGNKIAVYNANDKPGCIKYVDQNGDGTINADDKVRLGNSLPEFLYGGNISMGYKSWDFSLSFQGVGHQNVLFNSTWIQPLWNQWGAVPTLLLGKYWSSDNTEEQNRKAKYPLVTISNTGSVYAGSDYWLFNGAYFRVKDITVGYTVPARLLSKTFVKGLRVYANVTDLPAISNYPKGWDPEYTSFQSTFISTTFSLGLNVKF